MFRLVLNDDIVATATAPRPAVNIQDMIRSSSHQRTKPPVLILFYLVRGGQLYFSILSLACTDGFDVSLVYGKRSPWFTAKIPSCFEPGGILSPYRKSTMNSIRKK